MGGPVKLLRHRPYGPVSQKVKREDCSVQTMFRLFRQCSDFSDNVQTFQTMFRIFSQLSECSESVQSMFRISSEFSVNVQNVQTFFRISSIKTGLFRISWLCSDSFNWPYIITNCILLLILYCYWPYIVTDCIL